MDAKQLAASVVHWLEFERHCGRDCLFAEAVLKAPIHQFLAATDSNEVFLEHPYPGLPKGLAKLPGRKKSLDFCLRRAGGQKAYKHVIESKFVNANRAFAQELLDDLFRLRWLKLRKQSEPCSRWLLIAGRWDDLTKQVLLKGSTKRKQVLDKGLYGVLHRTLNKLHTFDIKNSSEAHRARWTKSVKRFLQTNLPSTFRTKLEAQFPAQNQVDNDLVCMIWRVVKTTRKRKT
jgi:hypothetical protein